MNFTELEIPSIILIKPDIFKDDRGYFYEAWQDKLFESAGLNYKFVQENCSGSVKGVLRGLHYQIQYSQGKLVKVTNGKVFDVSVDIRKSSPTFSKWLGIILSGENKHQLWIPPGFAHGYYVMSDYAEINYKTTEYYFPEFERTIKWDDPEINISWPLDNPPDLSEKDSEGVLLRNADLYE